MSNQHEWQFDNAWQEMLNHATIKVSSFLSSTFLYTADVRQVMEAETQKAESGREHQRRALIFKAAEEKVKQLEEKLQRHIVKSRPYFDEKFLCQEQLNTQKERVENIKREIARAKHSYSETLKQLERISNEIHMKRKGLATLESDILSKLLPPRFFGSLFLFTNAFPQANLENRESVPNLPNPVKSPRCPTSVPNSTSVSCEVWVL